MLEEGIYKLLSANSEVSALCGTRIHPAQLPEANTLPSIVYLQVTSNDINSLEGTNALKSKRMQFDCYAPDYGTAKRVARALHHALDGFRGTLTDSEATVVEAVLPVFDQDIFEYGPLSYRTVSDIEFWYIEQ